MKKNGHNLERGSAILVTLGILALVMVMAMAFAFTSRTNLQIAKVNSGSIKAKLISNSAVSQILADLREAGAANASIVHQSNLFQYTVDGDTDTLYLSRGGGRSENLAVSNSYYEQNNLLPNVLSTRSSYLDLYLSRLTATELNDFSFISVKDSNNDIVGRYAFAVINDSAKIDVNSVVMRNASNGMPIVLSGEHRIQQGNASFNRTDDYYYPIFSDYYGTETFDPSSTFSWSTAKSDCKKNGYFMGELGGILSLNDAYYTSADIVALDKKAPWFSYTHLMNEASFSSDYSKYTFFSGESPESYLDGSVERARFDISGYEWGHGDYYNTSNEPISSGSWESTSSSYSVRLSYARTLLNELTSTSQRPSFWASGDVVDVFTSNTTAVEPADVTISSESGTGVFNGGTGFGIPYLHGNDRQKKQVAANMIDYCDSDNCATYGKIGDYGSETMSFDELAKPSDMPDYFGNERVPAFSEIKIKLRPTCQKVEGQNKYSYNCDMDLDIEFFNPYFGEIEAITQDVHVVVKGYYQFDNETPHDFTVTSASASYGFSALAEQGFTTVNVPSINGFIPSSYICDANIGPAPDNTPSPKEVVEKVNITKVIMYLGNKDNGYGDLALWKTVEDDDNFDAGASLTTGTNSGVQIMDTTGHSEWITDDALGVGVVEFSSSLEAKDPAFNYDKEKTDELWQWAESSSKNFIVSTDTGSSIGSMGSINTCNYYSNYESTGTVNTYDKKAGMAAGNLQWYSDVKNAPFDSFRDLGNVHRGEIGRTLNLLAYSTSSNTLGDYLDGDARILDQIKIGPAKFRKGLISSMLPNTDNDATEALFVNIVDSSSISSGSMQYDATSAITGNEARYGRAAIPLYCIENYVDNCRQTESADIKDLEGAMANTISLMSSRYESFTIFVVAQALKQIGWDGAPDGINTRGLFGGMRSTLASSVEYTDNGRMYFCDIIGSDARMINVLYDTWARTFTVVHTEKLP